ncbi:glycyl-tRNA ligase subunit beta [Gracilibacillus halophilus YIM-C55.5]|uniref:Glycine--tRNA ligase beta subunit n=1 Tax=Gracilibacillus halophilus YIM-C55.5 TaxID=1308866 RepID=N4WE31_9BACI|nr:glycine--tRNA ligase subunit beta [Gracilibacillus halophilus]ENH97499.1 glycyl-tRNA ligase subunit beta [Gracilibacillus halophilus YIM-C55.5]
MKTTNVLFEIGLEEMPARFMDDTERQIKEKTINWLNDIRLSYETVQTFITPRRIAVLIKGLQNKQDDQVEEAKGPSEQIAVSEDGEWTKAAIGFSKGQGKSTDDIYFKEVKGTRYVYVEKFIEGQKAEALLPEFREIITSLHFPKSMRWSDQTLTFIRPIKWMLGLQDQQVIPFEIAGVKTSNVTYGHRFLGDVVTVTDPLQYERLLNEQFVIADAEKRKEMIRTGIQQLAHNQDWTITIDEKLLTEVTHLLEYPTVFYGTFDSSFLHIPKEVLITSMKEHQRYFPVENSEGELLPYFVSVRNGTDEYIDNVAKGNEKVLRARLQDSQFFYEEDQKHAIEAYTKQLDRMVFQEQLGTIADKVNRIREIAQIIADQLQLSDKEKQQIQRAAEICKFDLVTNMVDEFSELQGIMGRKYALIFGEDETVAQAIEEHYMPKHANAKLPTSVVGSVISMADKLDTIVGCFSVGIIPSGSQDPYALRRQAIGTLEILNHNQWPLNISELIENVQSIFKQRKLDASSETKVFDQLDTFFKQRTAYIMKEAKIESDIIDAVLVQPLTQFSFMMEKAKLLSNKRYDVWFKENQEAFVRVINLAAKANEEDEVNPTLFENNQEEQLYATYQKVLPDYQDALTNGDASQALDTLSVLTEPIHALFDHTMVMTEDEKLRSNRLALLKAIADTIKQFADLSLIQWKQHQGA